MRGPSKLLFGGLVVLYRAIKLHKQQLASMPHVGERSPNFSEKNIVQNDKITFLAYCFFEKVRTPFSKMRGPSKLLFGGLIVLYRTIKLHKQQLASIRHVGERSPDFSEKTLSKMTKLPF